MKNIIANYAKPSSIRVGHGDPRQIQTAMGHRDGPGSTVQTEWLSQALFWRPVTERLSTRRYKACHALAQVHDIEDINTPWVDDLQQIGVIIGVTWRGRVLVYPKRLDIRQYRQGYVSPTEDFRAS